MTTLTYSSGRIHLGVGAFILSLILSGFSMGCEEAAETSCEEQLWECDDMFTKVGENTYCMEQNRDNTEPGVESMLESCADFRRGQMCQCLSRECFQELNEDVSMHTVGQYGPWVYDSELDRIVGGLNCPVLYDAKSSATN